MLPNEVAIDSFEEFAHQVKPRLKDALSATLGSDLGRDATAEALAYGWEHWERVSVMRNPAGYLYPVGRDRGRRMLRQTPVALIAVDPVRTPWIEPGLPDALSHLSEQQRVAVMLLHCFEWTMTEVAEFLGVTKSTVQSHAERGMRSLRSGLGVTL